MAMLEDFKSSVALVVSSCDAFFDAWRPFQAFLEMFWHDCPLDIFLLTNELDIRSTRLRSIRVGKDRGWSSNLGFALQQLTHPYLLYFQEDYFLTAPVDRVQLTRDFEEAIGMDADSLCFRARSKADPSFQPLNERYGIVPLDSPGRTRCQVTLWKRSALLSKRAAALAPSRCRSFPTSGARMRPSNISCQLSRAGCGCRKRSHSAARTRWRSIHFFGQFFRPPHGDDGSFARSGAGNCGGLSPPNRAASSLCHEATR
jgi:hypothetical protein